MVVATPWGALRTTPLRLVASAVPWRCTAYLVTGVFSGLAVLLTFPLLLVLTGVGPVVAGVALAGIERRRLRWVDPRPAPSAHGRPDRPGPLGWLATRLREPATWQELAFAGLAGTMLWVAELVVVAFALCLTVLPGAAGPWSPSRRGSWSRSTVPAPSR